MPLDARLIYLLLYPYTPPAARRGAPTRPALARRAPYFLDLDLELHDLNQAELVIEGQSVSVRTQLFDEQIVVCECAYTLADPLGPTGNDRRHAIQAGLQSRLLREAGYTGPFVEEYTIVCLPAVSASPDEFVQSNRLALATLLRNLPRHASQAEVQSVLASRARYTDRDLTIVDWEGALLIDAEQDFQADIELLKIGNYELLRYRLLDHAIERNLQTVRAALARKGRLTFFNTVLRQALEQRLALLLEFEKTEQLLLLIGDWYSAQLYRLIVDEFYIDDWKTTVKSKLDQLETITAIIHENFTLSWDQTLDLVQLFGWLVLLVGYFVLFYFDVVAVLPAP